MHYTHADVHALNLMLLFTSLQCGETQYTYCNTQVRLLIAHLTPLVGGQYESAHHPIKKC